MGQHSPTGITCWLAGQGGSRHRTSEQSGRQMGQHSPTGTTCWLLGQGGYAHRTSEQSLWQIGQHSPGGITCSLTGQRGRVHCASEQSGWQMGQHSPCGVKSLSSGQGGMRQDTPKHGSCGTKTRKTANNYVYPSNIHAITNTLHIRNSGRHVYVGT